MNAGGSNVSAALEGFREYLRTTGFLKFDSGSTAARAQAERLVYGPNAVGEGRKHDTAPDILYTAAKLMADRGTQYDKPEGERSMGRAVQAFNIITGRDLQESEGWLLLQILKDVRDRQRKDAHTDSLHDCVAYAALKAEARLGGK